MKVLYSVPVFFLPGVGMCRCTISEMFRVVHAGVFAAMLEGRVGEVLAGSSGAGGEQGGVEEGSLVVQSHAAAVHYVCPAATLKDIDRIQVVIRGVGDYFVFSR